MVPMGILKTTRKLPSARTFLEIGKSFFALLVRSPISVQPSQTKHPLAAEEAPTLPQNPPTPHQDPLPTLPLIHQPDPARPVFLTLILITGVVICRTSALGLAKSVVPTAARYLLAMLGPMLLECATQRLDLETTGERLLVFGLEPFLVLVLKETMLSPLQQKQRLLPNPTRLPSSLDVSLLVLRFSLSLRWLSLPEEARAERRRSKKKPKLC